MDVFQGGAVAAAAAEDIQEQLAQGGFVGNDGILRQADGSPALDEEGRPMVVSGEIVTKKLNKVQAYDIFFDQRGPGLPKQKLRMCRRHWRKVNQRIART